MPPINYIGVNNLRNHNLYSVNTNPNPYFWGSVSLNLTLTLGWTCLLQVTNTLAALLSLDPGLWFWIILSGLISFHDSVPDFSPFNSAVMSSNCLSRTKKAQNFLLFRLQRRTSPSSGVWPDSGAQRKLGSLSCLQSSIFLNLSSPSSYPAGLTLPLTPIHLSMLADNPGPPSSHFLMLYHRRACQCRRLCDGNLRSVGGEVDGRGLRMKDPSRRRSRCLVFFFSYASTHKLAPVRVLENAVQTKRQ